MSMNLEDPLPVPPAESTPPAPAVESQPAAAPVVPDPDEAQAIEVQGGKMVPLAALKAAREEAKAAKADAARVQQLEAELAQARPYQQFVQQNPQLLQPRAEPQPAPTQADPELVRIARLMDYIKQDGSPDLSRAKEYQGLLNEKAAAIAQQMVQPVAAMGYQQQSNANWAQVVTAKTPTGQPLDPHVLGEFWRHLPVDKTADPRVAALVRDLAITEQMRRSPLPAAPAPPAAPPIHTESIGRMPQPAARLTDTERNVAAQRGITEDKYRTLTKDFTPGRMNPLED